MKFLGQHANQQLFDLDQQRKILDSYAECQTLCTDFLKAWNEKKDEYTDLNWMSGSVQEGQTFLERD